MSYNVAICLPPVSDHDAVAWSELDGLIDQGGSPGPEFVELHAKLTDRYPCICDLPDDEVDDGAWSDGPLINNFGQKAAVIGMVNSRVGEVLPFVIANATSMGLIVFDWGTTMIHRPVTAPRTRRPWWRFW